ncbi:hypothetical protein PJL18_01976 [Paenarthrobacter nicotinovorans]|nr:hypothetical protein [Paenarthrobacter nicotinovorans]
MDQAIKYFRTCGLGKGRQFAQRVLGVGQGTFCPQTSQHNAFEAQLPVFDLCDVFEFSRQPRGAAQGATLGQVFLVAVVDTVLLVQGRDGLRLAEHTTGVVVFGCLCGGILGKNPVDDGLDLFRTHVLGVGIGSGVLLGGHGLLRLFGNSRIVLFVARWGALRAGLTGLGQSGLLCAEHHWPVGDVASVI